MKMTKEQLYEMLDNAYAACLDNTLLYVGSDEDEGMFLSNIDCDNPVYLKNATDVTVSPANLIEFKIKNEVYELLLLNIANIPQKECLKISFLEKEESP